MRISELVATSAEVGGTSSRTGKTAALARAIAALPDDELAAGVAFLAGRPAQERLEVGWATLADLQVPPATTSSLGIRDVEQAMAELAEAEGPGSGATRRQVLVRLLSDATAAEQEWLRSVLLRELRQGAGEGVVVAAIADAADVPSAAVRRALALCDDLGEVALRARAGVDALASVGLRVGRFVRPMLATAAADLQEVLTALGEVIVDVKLDGARVQVHRDGAQVSVFTRNGNDVTARVPEVVAAALACDADVVVLDGEALALGAAGEPRPFQETMRRFGTQDETAAAELELPLDVRFFDVLAASGGAVARRADPSLLDAPLTRRLQVLDAVVPAARRVERTVGSDHETLAGFVGDALARRLEGVMLKDPQAPYTAGRRGKGWRKLKPVHTLDLVVLAAEWGSGRRRGWLSNLHLGAYDPDRDGFVMLGKTFKGLTDEMLRWQTVRLLELETRRTRGVVHVAPELVAEVALDGFVTSPRYPAGIALRFARVVAHRPDKDARDADTVATARAVHAGALPPRLPG